MYAEPTRGDWVRCPHCEGDGQQSGPGGLEECCHCHGRGERWFDEDELEDARNDSGDDA